MEMTEKISQLENEIKVLKNEVQTVLLDIRDNILNAENPFNTNKTDTKSQPIVVHTVSTQSLDSSSKPNTTATYQPGNSEKPANVIHTNPIKPHTNEHLIGNVDNNDNKPEAVHDTLNTTDQQNLPSHCPETRDNCEKKKQPDLIKYAALTSWVEDSTKQIGPERTRVILELSEIAGLLPVDVTNTLIKLTSVKNGERIANLAAKDYFRSLVKIAAISGTNNENNTALLQVLSQGDVDG